MSTTNDQHIGHGRLFRNTDKSDPRHADYSGKADLDGQEYYLDAWINQAKDGGKSYLKLRLKPASIEPAAAPTPDDLIPF